MTLTNTKIQFLWPQVLNYEPQFWSLWVRVEKHWNDVAGFTDRENELNLICAQQVYLHANV